MAMSAFPPRLQTTETQTSKDSTKMPTYYFFWGGDYFFLYGSQVTTLNQWRIYKEAILEIWTTEILIEDKNKYKMIPLP